MSTRIRRTLWFVRSRLIGAVVLSMIAMTVAPVTAAEKPTAASDNVALEATSWLLTIPYGAVKLAYALGGAAVGGLAWVVTGGNTEVAQSIWTPSITGDYIVRPENLSGERPLHFVGQGSGT